MKHYGVVKHVHVLQPKFDEAPVRPGFLHVPGVAGHVGEVEPVHETVPIIRHRVPPTQRDEERNNIRNLSIPPGLNLQRMGNVMIANVCC